MAPAVTIIPPASDGEARPICKSCAGELADVALKCTNCKGHIHLRCSGMPEYQLVRLSVSQASYMCWGCVKTKDADNDEEKYNAECTKMREVVAKEISIIDQLHAADKGEEQVNVTGNETSDQAQDNKKKNDNGKERDPVVGKGNGNGEGCPTCV